MIMTVFFILLLFITIIIWSDMNDGNDPRRIPRNKFLSTYIKWHFKYINMVPVYKTKIAAYIFKYGLFVFIVMPIIILVIFFGILYFEFHFSIIEFIFCSSDSYKWFSFSVAFGTLIFGIHKYHDNTAVKIGTDVPIYKNNVKLQFLSRKGGSEYIKMNGPIKIYQNGGVILDKNYVPDKLYNQWASYNQYLNKYQEWKCVKGYELMSFIIMNEKTRSNMQKMIKFAKCYAKKLRGPDKNLYFVINYDLNHKMLSRSVRISVNSIEKLALNSIEEPTDEDMKKFNNRYWFHPDK